MNSCLHVVILIGYDSNDGQSQETNEAVANALIANLNMRQMSDCYLAMMGKHRGAKDFIFVFILSPTRKKNYSL